MRACPPPSGTPISRWISLWPCMIVPIRGAGSSGASMRPRRPRVMKGREIARGSAEEPAAGRFRQDEKVFRGGSGPVGACLCRHGRQAASRDKPGQASRD